MKNVLGAKRMAEIRKFTKEKKVKGQKNKLVSEYEEKIHKHKLSHVYRVLLIALVVGAIGMLVIFQYIRHVYTDYEVVSSIEIPEIHGTVNVPFENNVLTYSNDGAHCSDTKGNIKWNMTYEMQNPMVVVCEKMVAVADYNGRIIYVSDQNGKLGEIQTNMPIHNICISATGLVIAVLEDTDITWVYLYDSVGNVIAKMKTTMEDFGYPVALNVSPDGTLLMVSFLYLDAGCMRTSVAFFNFAEVGKSQLDNLVSVYNYSDAVFPCVQFLNNGYAVAIGDNQIVFYQGINKPEFVANNLYNRQVQGVYHNEEYVGLVFLNDTGESRYQFVIYDKTGVKQNEFNFDMEYTDLFFDKETFVIYNETECMIHTISGREKFIGKFEKQVQLMVPTDKAFRYNIITQDSMDTIALQ